MRHESDSRYHCHCCLRNIDQCSGSRLALSTIIAVPITLPPTAQTLISEWLCIARKVTCNCFMRSSGYIFCVARHVTNLRFKFVLECCPVSLYEIIVKGFQCPYRDLRILETIIRSSQGELFFSTLIYPRVSEVTSKSSRTSLHGYRVHDASILVNKINPKNINWISVCSIKDAQKTHTSTCHLYKFNNTCSIL